MIAGIIPARYASTRFPGKPLADIKGKTMIERVYEQASMSKALSTVVVATDDERIAAHVRSFGGNVVMTAAHHPSGTDRCHEALLQLKGSYRYVMNIQGDEPFIVPAQIDELAAALADGTTEIATQMIAVRSYEELADKGEVKIVLNSRNEALYFSRMTIPFIKGVDEREWHLHHTYYRHVGMYAYRADILEAITRLPVSALEKAESLEQLRWVESGYRIRCVPTTYESHCIDTPEDLERMVRRM
ncbi:3-deoxy-manno-octulosonate cytidylyltransferase [Nemorincola caseinilytica]|uniref:3-deoxy-manno-octulosonate cytidylyltransferase n=1 Tax=Nemorincola caseinilytica TaxID=2054315 RepID=A0ABP8N6W6_9BACT